MTIKLSRTSSPQTNISIPDSPLLTLPTGDWAIGCVVVFNGELTTGGYQTLFRTGNSGEAGGLIGIFDPPSSTTSASAGRFYFQFDGSTSTYACKTDVVDTTKPHLLVLNKSGGSVFSKLTPISSSAPIDGANVRTGAGGPLPQALNGAQGLILGTHSISNRKFDQSIARFFIIQRALSDFEIAQLAYGKEVTDFATPVVYLRMNDTTDIVDSGPNAFTVTTSGPIVAGGNPSFGYNSLPSSPGIEGNPVITGAPVVGTATGFTEAPVTGNPFPTASRQWSLDGVDIAGATGITYTPVAGDAGKQLRVRQIATNGSGTTNATSDPANVSSGAVGLTMAELPADRIYQRIAGAATVAISGTFEGTAPSKIEYQLYAPDGITVTKPWADSGATIGSGTWTAAPSIPAPTDGMKYRIAVRSKNGADNVIFTTEVKANRFGVGEIIGIIGSSSPAAWFGAGSGTGISVNQNMASAMDAGTGEWLLFGTSGRAGQMSEYIAQRIGVPVGMFTAALGGSTLLDWGNANGSLMARFNGALAFAGGKLGGVFLSAGSNDVTVSSSAQTVADHLALLRIVRDNVRASAGQPNLPALLSGINRRTDALELQANNARQAECLFGDDPNCYHVQTLDFELGESDGVHLTGQGYADCCARIQYVWAEARLGTYRRGPKILSMVHEGNRVQATLAHRNGSDFVPMSGITGFIVSDASGAATITAAERTDATRLLLTCDRALTNPTVTYLAGAAPLVGTPVYDNGAVPLPMTVETQMTTVTGTISSDQGPILSSPVASATGSATASGSVSTDQSNGTLYRYVSGNVTEPGSVVKAANLTSAVVSSGVQNVSFTGIPANSNRYAHYLHRNAAGLDSAVVSSPQFTTAEEADTTPPLITGASVANGAPSTVVLTASEALNEQFAPAASSFTVAGHTVNSASVGGNLITLSVSPAFSNGEASRTVSYTKPVSGGARDLAGNVMESFTGRAIANFVSGATSTVTSVSVVPGTATVQGDSTIQLSAIVGGTNSPSQGVNWSRSPNVGSISSAGLYLAGSATSAAQVITITATSLQNGSVSGTSVITIPAAGSQGPFTSYQLTSSGTLRVSQECKYTWFAGAVVGVSAGAATHGTSTTTAQGRLVVSDLPTGPGFMLMKFSDGGISYQEGVIT